MSGAGLNEQETCQDYVVPALVAAGWSPEQIIEQYPITDGRIVQAGKRHKRARPLRADYVLEYRPGLPVAVVEAKRSYSEPGKGMQQGKRYARLLDLPLAYATNGNGIVEDDRHTGHETFPAHFPIPDEAWQRFQAFKRIATDEVAAGVLAPFNRALRTSTGAVKEPRYYQRVAINRTVQKILEGDTRALLVLATGTGKTFVAMQIIWKLWEAKWRGARNPRVLYLADRNILIDQPITREFKPAFGEGPIHKFEGETRHGRELYFALYQNLTVGGDEPLYRRYDPDFFDLIVVDECHRGSANADSEWRAILEHFSPAAQLGLTATPIRSEDADTYRYFGAPLYEYSLAQGIDDGFLAPYRVRRVVLSADAFGFAPDAGQLDLFGHDIPDGLYTTRQFERVVSLLSRTEAAARHLTKHLRKTDRMAKTIVFCVNSEHADEMRRALHNANDDLTTRYPDYAVRIVSAEGDIGKGYLDEFADNESPTPVIATTAQLLSTGVDLPTVKNIVLFRTIGSMALFKQIIGRGTRLAPDEDKLSFEIIDYSGATALFEDPDFDGPPEVVIEEEIDNDGEVVTPPMVEQPEPEYDHSPENPPTAGELDDDERVRKFYVDDEPMWVVSEGIWQLDGEGGRLRLVEYTDFVADEVRRLFAAPAGLRASWKTAPERTDVVDALANRGIDLDELAERTGVADADPLDLLIHLAWNEPLMSRRDRTRRLRKEHTEFLDEFRPEARAVIDELLDKYAEHGIGQLEDLHVLQVPPLTDLGSPVEIAGRFGGSDELRRAIADLQEQLYAA
jgi:type I restriction enzyme R subunit